VTLHCVCGTEVWGAEDLFFWAVDGLLHARCRKPHCRLAKTLTVERVKDRASHKVLKNVHRLQHAIHGEGPPGEKSRGAWTQDCKTAARAKRVKTTHNTSINISRAAQK
jgi:hypothetical protein